MARKRVLTNPERVTFNIEAGLRREAAKNAYRNGYGFSEYISRLLIADINRKTTAAKSVSRVFRAAPAL